MLELRLLGSPQILLNGEPFAGLSAVKSQALLFYLAMTPRPLSRLSLAGLLWPDKNDREARANMRQAVHNLHKVIPDHIAATRNTIALAARAPLVVDALDFAEEARCGLDGDLAALQRAEERYSGSFLDGFFVDAAAPFEDWLLMTRERLHILALQVFQRLADGAATDRALDRALHYTGRLLALEPWREDVHSQTMRLLAASGQRTAALAQYEQCRQALATELGVLPSAETVALYEEIRDGRFPDAAASASQPTAAVNAVAGPQPLRRLPTPLTSFVGRQRDLAAIQALLRPAAQADPQTEAQSGPPVRLVTLTGPGGVGKTRLALQAAHLLRGSFVHGVCYVELAQLTETRLVAETIAAELGVRELVQRPLLQTLGDFLHRRQLLLVLDNCEHLIEACARLVESLLQQAPDLRVLATSRERLRIDGERLHPVSPLALPEATLTAAHADLLAFGAVQLFADRAGAVWPAFTITSENAGAVVQICQQLDGIPLAIELAAAALRMLSVEQIANHLAGDSARRLRLLAQGSRTAAARHRTLHGLVSWSYSLLSRKEQILLRQLSIFAGGWTLPAAEAVCALDMGGATGDREEIFDLLVGLVEKSLVVVSETRHREARYGLLGAIRDYASLQLDEAGERSVLMARHLDYFVGFMQQWELRPPAMSRADWQARIGPEIENIRAALGWALGEGKAAGLRLALVTGEYWFSQGMHRESLHWLERLVAMPQLAGEKQLRLAALSNMEFIQWWALGNYERAHALQLEALALAKALGDRERIEKTLNNLAGVALRMGDYDQAHRYLEESGTLVEASGNLLDQAWHAILLGEVMLVQEEVAPAKAQFEKAAQILRIVQNPSLLGYPVRRLGQIALRQGQGKGAALDFYRESLDLNLQTGDLEGKAACVVAYADLFWQMGAVAQATLLCAAVTAALDASQSQLAPYDAQVYAALRTQLPGDRESSAAGWVKTSEGSLAEAIDLIEAWLAQAGAAGCANEIGSFGLLGSAAVSGW